MQPPSCAPTWEPPDNLFGTTVNLRFDDRLVTVLNQPADTAFDRAVRWRQLVELVAGAGPGAADPMVVRAITAIRSDRLHIDEPMRAAAARAIAGMKAPPELVALFAEDVASVSGPLLASAELEPEQWRVVIQGASTESRELLATIRPDIALTDDQAGEQEPAIDPAQADERPLELEQPIEHAASEASKPLSPLFRWECGPSGQIDWVEGVPRGAVIGRSIGTSGINEGVDPSALKAFVSRAPFTEATLLIEGDGDASGEWRVSGSPAFDKNDGRFAGYRGLAVRRETDDPNAAPAGGKDPDSMRELVHELKTPLNAIIGFAEIIDGQYLGPAHRRYRERAAEILRQAWTLLDAVEDVDLAAKLSSGRYQPGQPIAITRLVGEVVEAIKPRAEGRAVTIALDQGVQDPAPEVDEWLGRRLISRLAILLLDNVPPGETLEISTAAGDGHAHIRFSLPAALGRLTSADLSDPRADLTEVLDDNPAAALGLRLIRTLLAASGRSLVISSGRIELTLPSLLRS